ncbi:hypothetical protein ACIRJL_17170 [Streptomyces sp. NPDC102383]|uniref:hypothetical protein n=1 Tax=Streptomyces sp. NPDC102383 TaxID=3366165 RepID=UPI00382CABAD
MAESTERNRAAALAHTPADVAFRGLLDHVVSCARCAYNWRQCPTRQVLAAMLRDARAEALW